MGRSPYLRVAEGRSPYLRVAEGRSPLVNTSELFGRDEIMD